MKKSCFGTYDIRGKFPEEINEEIAYRIGAFFPRIIEGRKIVVGRDVRLSSINLFNALCKGLTDVGCEVVDIGIVGTEMVYFAVPNFDLDGGIMITASHNPKDYNGMKFVVKNSAPLDEIKFRKLESLVEKSEVCPYFNKGYVKKIDLKDKYVNKLLSYVDADNLRPYRIVVNAGNGTAGYIIDELEKYLPFEFVKLNCVPDGKFPHGVPNPLLPHNQESTTEVISSCRADFGVAWDGDFDRCFMFDETGRFIDACYMVGFLAEAFLSKEPGARIVHDTRAVWNIEDSVLSHGGHPMICPAGHVFFKRKMREVGAVYGGELSAHHYFRDFYFCDSGMIPWLIVAELMSKSGRKLSEMLNERIKKFFVSKEINIRVRDVNKCIQNVKKIYAGCGCVQEFDGVSVDCGDWRFNLRVSKTEYLLRLNVESKGDRSLCNEKVKEIEAILL